MSYINWYSTIAKKSCYETLDEIKYHSYTMPFEWYKGKKVFPYGHYWTLKNMAKWRKDIINKGKNSLIGDYAEPCIKCQIKDKCDAGFPEEQKGFLGWLKEFLLD